MYMSKKYFKETTACFESRKFFFCQGAVVHLASLKDQ